MGHRVYLQEQLCWSAFRVFDKDGDNHISISEIREVLGELGNGDVLHKDHLEALMQEIDINNDGNIDFDEFMRMMSYDCHEPCGGTTCG